MSDPVFDSLLNHTCTIKRRSVATTTVDKWGAGVETITSVGTGVACKVQQRAEAVEFTRRGEKVISRHIAFFKIGANIQEDDIVVFDNISYRVAAVEDAAGMGHHLEVALFVLEN